MNKNHQQETLQQKIPKLLVDIPVKLREFVSPGKLQFYLDIFQTEKPAWIGEVLSAIFGWERRELKTNTFNQCHLDRKYLNSNLALPPPKKAFFVVEKISKVDKSSPSKKDLIIWGSWVKTHKFGTMFHCSRLGIWHHLALLSKLAFQKHYR